MCQIYISIVNISQALASLQQDQYSIFSSTSVISNIFIISQKIKTAEFLPQMSHLNTSYVVLNFSLQWDRCSIFSSTSFVSNIFSISQNIKTAEFLSQISHLNTAYVDLNVQYSVALVLYPRSSLYPFFPQFRI